MSRAYVATDGAKECALGHVFYEMQQLWLSSQLVSPEPLIMNAYLESMLVHVRVLLDFFEHEHRSAHGSGAGRRENDDVLSLDYGFPARPIDLDGQYRARLNKDLVHLSYSRNERRLPDGKMWHRAVVVRPLVERCVEFVDALGEGRWQRTGETASKWRDLRANLARLISEP